MAQWYRNACWCNACFKFNQFQVIKASKYDIFEGYL